MKILIVASTIQEVLPFIESAQLKEKTKNKLYVGEYKLNQIDLLITGIGMVATTYNLTKAFASNSYDLAINIGIAGSFKKYISLGEVVNVEEDRFSEIGVEDGDDFISMDELNLNNIGTTDCKVKMETPSSKVLKIPKSIKNVKGITVNTVHGNEKSISKIVEKYNPDIETMEGAAFMYVCEAENVNFLQIRSISNYVEKRNKEKWNISLAIDNHNYTLLSLLEKC